ncbi:MAG TPA: hypothetical protein VEZ90_09725 [Blastocatellia bacterium]|nr:hypothetical protein [Blastocatellia bacterium]
MRQIIRNSLAALLLLLFVSAGSPRPVAAPRAFANIDRIAFQIAAIEDTATGAKTISRSTIEGPPGTDFEVLLHGNATKISAAFLTDPISDSQIRLRAKVKTDRLYGYSANKLPLYEEGAVSDDLKMGFDEVINLYPFGQNGADNLRIEITPIRTANPVYDAAGAQVPLRIRALDITPDNPVSLKATRQPHHYTVKASLLEDGVEVATGSSDCLLQEPSEFSLAPTGTGSSIAPMTLGLTVEEYTRDRPADNVTVGFNLYKGTGPTDKLVPLLSNWEGVGSLGSQLTYDLGDAYPNASGHKMSLKLFINAAPAEVFN